MRMIFLLASSFVLLSETILTLLQQLSPAWYLLTLPMVALGISDMLQTKKTLLRNYPIFGHGRYIMEVLRPKIYQYFVESDTDGTPINRITRSVVYQRAKEQL